MSARKPVVKKAVRKRSRPLTLAVEAPAAEPLRLGRALALVIVLAAFGVGAYRSAAQKVAQHVVAPRIGNILRQGDTSESISALQALKALPGGGFATLMHRPDGWRVQLWDEMLNLKTVADIPVKAVGELVDLACLKDGQLWLGARDGRIWRLDAKLKPTAPFASGIKDLRGLDGLPDGSVAGLDVTDGELWRLGSDGKALSSTPSPEAVIAKNMAVFPDGALALLQVRKGGVWVCVLDAAGKLERRIEIKGIIEAAPTRLATSGNVILVNDSRGSVGVVYYHRSGKPLGNTIGVGQFPIAHPGWVGGEASGKIAYIHYADGLVKVGLPWGEQP